MKKIHKLCCLLITVMAMFFVLVPVQAQAASAKLNKTQIKIGVGQEETLKVQKSKAKVKWSSSNEKIVTVSKGTIKGIKAGSAVITAKVGKQSLSCKVVVKKYGLEKTSIFLIATQKETLKLKDISKSVKWSSSNKKVAIVDKKGKVTAKSAGKAKIFAKVGKTTYTCDVKVDAAGMNKRSTVVYLRQPVKLNVIGVKGKITWSSSNKKIAKVDKNGKVTAVKKGKATIKATVDGKTYKCKVTVKKPGLASKNISVDEASTVKINLLGATIKKVKSSDKSIASVSKKGIVKGIKEGKCIITVTDTKKKTYKCNVTVNGVHDINTNDVESPYFDTTKTSVIVGENYQLILNDNTKDIRWYSDNSAVASVDSHGLVSGIAVGTTVINAEVEGKVYSCTMDVVSAGSPSMQYTRGEWISILLPQVGINIDEYQDEILPYYCDTTNHEYGRAIEIAKVMGIIPATESEEDVPEFRPDDIATREFAAVTAVSALGYQQPDRTITFDDAGQITYKAAVDIAVKEKMFILSDNKFYPGTAVTEADKVRIFTRIYELLNAPNNIMEHAHIKYADDVIVNKLANYTDYSVTQNADGTCTVVINNDNQTVYLKKGYKAVLPANNDYPSGVVVQLNADAATAKNKVTFTGIAVTDMSQIATDINVSGYGKVMTDAITTEEGVAVSYVDAKGAPITNTELNNSYKGEASAGSLKFDLDDFEIKDVKVSGSINVELPKVTASCVKTGLTYKEISLHVDPGVTLEADFTSAKKEDGDKEPFEKKLGEIPIALPAGFNVTLEAKLYAELDGSFKVEVSAKNSFGVVYKDGELRGLGRTSQLSLTVPKLEGSAEAGLSLGADLNFTVFALLGAEFKVGPKAQASAEITLTGLKMDAAVFLSMKIEMKGDDTALGWIMKTFLHFDEMPSWTIFDEDNSPWRKNLHFLNGQLSDEPIEKGYIVGAVYAADGLTPIAHARVIISSKDYKSQVLYTDAIGGFSTKQINAGTYTLKISATGYKTFISQEEVEADNITYTEALMMVDRSNVNNGKVEGYTYNAVGGYVSGASYVVRKGWNATTSGEVVATGTLSGIKYSFDLAPGNYTLNFTMDGFTASCANVIVLSNRSVVQNVTLSPVGTAGINGQMRIVLTWGEQPRDLDSHLLGPTADGTDRFHIYFSNKKYYSDNKLMAMLDVDDTTSYGPETTTIYNMNATGIYSYYVHNYSDGWDEDSSRLSTSHARIQVYDGDTLIATYNVPVNHKGTLWHVFDYDAAAKRIIVKNEFVSDYDTENRAVAPESLINTEFLEKDDINVINESINTEKITTELETESETELETESETESEAA